MGIRTTPIGPIDPPVRLQLLLLRGPQLLQLSPTFFISADLRTPIVVADPKHGRGHDARRSQAEQDADDRGHRPAQRTDRSPADPMRQSSGQRVSVLIMDAPACFHSFSKAMDSGNCGSPTGVKA